MGYAWESPSDYGTLGAEKAAPSPWEWLSQGLSDVANRQRESDAASMRVFQTLRQHGEPSPEDWNSAILGGPILNAFGVDAGTFGGLRARGIPGFDEVHPSGAPKWFEGVEGLPKFEINDFNSRLTPYGENVAMKSAVVSHGGISNPYRLGDLLSHPDLYTHYPHLQDMRVYFDPNMDKLGFHTPGGQLNSSITLNPIRNQRYRVWEGDHLIEYNQRPATPDEVHSVALHEIQHAIQGHEEFALGGNAEWLQAKAVALRGRLQQEIFVDQMTGHNIDQKMASLARVQKIIDNPREAYYSLSGEVEARNVQKRLEMQREGVKNWGRDPNVPFSMPASATEDIGRGSQMTITDWGNFPRVVSHDPFLPPSASNPHPVEGDPFAR